MLDFSPSLESPIKAKDEKIELTLNQFQICTVSQKEVGLLHKKIVYAHHDGKKIQVVILDPKKEKITRL